MQIFQWTPYFIRRFEQRPLREIFVWRYLTIPRYNKRTSALVSASPVIISSWDSFRESKTFGVASRSASCHNGTNVRGFVRYSLRARIAIYQLSVAIQQYFSMMDARNLLSELSTVTRRGTRLWRAKIARSVGRLFNELHTASIPQRTEHSAIPKVRVTNLEYKKCSIVQMKKLI